MLKSMQTRVFGEARAMFGLRTSYACRSTTG